VSTNSIPITPPIDQFSVFGQQWKTAQAVRGLDGFKDIRYSIEGSNSGSSINLSGDADMLNLSLAALALMSHNATKNID
jgi:hypothetical protein